MNAVRGESHASSYVGIECPRSYIEVLGIRTAYWRRGNGRTLVLLHGSSPGACTELNWFKNFDALVAMGFDVIGFDQPGYGNSEAPQDHSVEFRYRHAEAFLKAIHLDSAILVGNSMGGLLVVLLNDRLNRKEIDIQGLVLLAQVPHFEMGPEVRAQNAAHRARLGSVQPTFEAVKKLSSNTLYNRAYLTDELVSLRLSMLSGRNYAAFQARAAGNDDFDHESVRSRPVSTPTLVMWGLNDKSLTPDFGVEAMRHFTDAQFLFVPRCGHWPQTEQTKIFHRALVGFVDDVEQSLRSANSNSQHTPLESARA